jgi:hypothetical protein
MLIAYLDESYDSEMKRVFVAAGFIARYEGWHGVEWRWKALLEGQFKKPPFGTHPAKLSREQRGAASGSTKRISVGSVQRTNT